MRFLIEAIKDISKSVGDHNFRNKKGETVEVSSGEVETALSPMLDGSYKLVEEIPESDAEKERFKDAAKQERIQADLSQAGEKFVARQDAEKSALGKLSKEALIKKAARLKIDEAKTLSKQLLVEKITESKFENQPTGATGTAVTGDTTSFATGAQSSQDAVDAAAITTQTTANAGDKQNVNTGGKQNAKASGKQNAKASGKQNANAAAKQNANAAGKLNADTAANTTQTNASVGGKQTVTAGGSIAGAAGQTSNISGNAPATTGGGKGVI